MLQLSRLIAYLMVDKTSDLAGAKLSGGPENLACIYMRASDIIDEVLLHELSAYCEAVDFVPPHASTSTPHKIWVSESSEGARCYPLL